MALKGLRSFVQELVTIYLLLSKVYEHLEEVKDNYNCVCVCVCVRAYVRACVRVCACTYNKCYIFLYYSLVLAWSGSHCSQPHSASPDAALVQETAETRLHQVQRYCKSVTPRFYMKSIIFIECNKNNMSSQNT